ncbi:lysyl-tRNA synthetase [Oryzobacter sp. R7]|uniref:lysyl-tRNA synthetase n=1 Tax=Oryzobacter faecalis TaxID=3388656 RepID=UPI00398D64B3
MDAVWPYLTAIVPTIAVAVLFYFLIRSMIEGDRRERLAQKQFEREQDARTHAPETDGNHSHGTSAQE